MKTLKEIWASAMAFQAGLRERFAVWWSVPPHAATTAFLTLLLLTAAGFWYVQKTGTDSDRQFCQLFRDTSNTQIEQFQQTSVYLASPAGMKHTPINDFIRRVSVPQLSGSIEARKQSFPEVCRQFGPPPSLPPAVPSALFFSVPQF